MTCAQQNNQDNLQEIQNFEDIINSNDKQNKEKFFKGPRI